MAPVATPCSLRLLLASSAYPPPLRLFRAAVHPLLPGSRCGGLRLRIRCGAADEEAEARRREQVKASVEEMAPGRDLVTLAACLVSLLTGVAVVLFNLSVHEIRDLLWDGIPLRGASWLREEPTGEIWQRVILVPVSGGIIVGGLNTLRSSIKTNSDGTGSSIKGFNAAVAGCFFAVESVLWPSSGNSSPLSNSTPMVILSAVIASVISEIGLGSDPAFTVPEYDFRSPTELPLYLLLGVFCGLVSITLSRCTALTMDIVESLQKATGLPRAASPALGGLIVGLLALIYPEVLYWGFENVDILLESRPFTSGLSASVLVQLIGVKILATSLCRAFGLVGGYYAPSLFIGAATGMAYGKFMRFTFTGSEALFHVPFLDVASPQAYGLVGMAATLAGVCKVPLTSVLLLFELTQDYRIVLPLLGAVGLSSWIASPQRFSTSSKGKLDRLDEKTNTVQEEKIMSSQTQQVTSVASVDSSADLCKLESSLCVYDVTDDNMLENLSVAEAMKTRYVSVSVETPAVEALNLMLAEKQPFVMITESNKSLVGLLTLKDFQDFCKTSKTTRMQTKVQERLVSHVCEAVRRKMLSVTPQMPLTTAEKIMDSHGVDQVPVVSEHFDHQDGGLLIGFVDRECITIARRALAAREFFTFTSEIRREQR